MGRPKKDGKRKIKDPNKPKRPTSAYFFYAEACRNELKKEGKKITKVGEFTKEVSVKWNALNPTEKKPYSDKAEKDKARYTAQMAAYKGKVKDVNKPKRPQSSYFLFLHDFRAKMKSANLQHKEILTKAGEAWKSLQPDEKKVYEKKAEIEKQKYEEVMKEYNKSGAAAAAATANANAKRARLDAEAAAKNGREESEEEDDDDEDDDDDYEDDDDE